MDANGQSALRPLKCMRAIDVAVLSLTVIGAFFDTGEKFYMYF